MARTWTEEQKQAQRERMLARQTAAGTVPPEAPSSGLKRNGLPGRGNINAPRRGRLMVEPRCMVWNPDPQNKHGGEWQTGGPCEQDWIRNWWNRCPHDPYFQHTVVKVRHPIIPDRLDGRRIITGYEEEEEELLQPRWHEVLLQVGQGQKEWDSVTLYKGWKLPEEMGYYPTCEFYGCMVDDPALIKNQIGNGMFCSFEHARLVQLIEGEVVLSVDWGEQAGESKVKRQQQLAGAGA